MNEISEYFFKQNLTGFNKKYKYFKLENGGANMVHYKATQEEIDRMDTSNWSFCGFEGEAPIFEEAVIISNQDVANNVQIYNELEQRALRGEFR